MNPILKKPGNWFMAEIHKDFGGMGEMMACYLEVLSCWTIATDAPKVGPSIL